MFIRLASILIILFTGALHSQDVPSKNRLANHYRPEFLRVLQIAFGSEEILSQGGIESVDIMFKSFDFNNKKILDIGSGFGGVDIYLAEKFDVEIVGVDIEPFMTQASEYFLEKHKNSLLGKVSFLTLREPCRLDEIEDEAFDAIISKEAFYSVPREEKQAYLAQAYRKLKPGGEIIISDWFKSPVTGEALKRAAKNEKVCQFVTPLSFCEMLQNANFQNMNRVDNTAEHIRYTQEDCQRLAQSSALFCELFGEEVYSMTVKDWQYWLEAQEAGELLSMTFFAKKPQ